MGGAASLDCLKACALLRLDAGTLQGLPPAERAKAIDSAFRRHAASFHPDKGGDPTRFQELSAARDDLKQSLNCGAARPAEEPREAARQDDAADLIEEMLNKDEEERAAKEFNEEERAAKENEEQAEASNKEPDEQGFDEGAETYHNFVRRVMMERNITYRAAQKVVKEEGLRETKSKAKELKVSELLRLVLDGRDIPTETPKELVEAEAHLLAQKLSQAKKAKKVNEVTVKTYEGWQRLFLEKKVLYLRETGKHIEADVAEETAAKRAKYLYHRQRADYHARQADKQFEELAGTASRAAKTAQAFQ
jgi:hypothetical protein